MCSGMQGGVTVEGNNLSLQNSLIYGATAGYYFDTLKWYNFNLGIETEVFNSQQAASTSVPNVGKISVC
jgi:hypothetical protein